MHIREIKDEDMESWTRLVSQLSPEASLGTKTKRSAFIDLTRLQEKTIFVVEDGFRLIGTASVLFETKVNRGTNPDKNGELFRVAHVEEVVIDEARRGSGIGKYLMNHVVDYCKTQNVYKIILDCSEDNVKFYEECGFNRHEVCMRMSL